MPPAQLHGLLVVDKPAGWTSHDVVARVRRLAGQRRIGHAGTLDPSATGLVVLGLGQGTRLLDYLLHGEKSYAATVCFGAATDTYDADGAVTVEMPWRHITEAAILAALPGFTGEIMQRPPVYSAIKQGGQPLYRLARRGVAVDVAPRPVTVSRLTLTAYNSPTAEFMVSCSGGTYIRSLAHDLGASIGSAAHLTALRRVRVGPFILAEALRLEQLIDRGRDGLIDALVALDRTVWQLPAVIVGTAQAQQIATGGAVLAPAVGSSSVCRAYSEDGRFLALLRYEAADLRWRAHNVFSEAFDTAEP
jgi:tRNA pseudouridine55 synthase